MATLSVERWIGLRDGKGRTSLLMVGTKGEANFGLASGRYAQRGIRDATAGGCVI